MFNITLYSLFASNIYGLSPLLISNYLSCFKCHYTHFTSILFYNQKYLLLKSCTFSKSTNGIVINEINKNPYDIAIVETDNLGVHSTFYNIEFNSSNNNVLYFERPPTGYDSSSISIIHCVFQHFKLLNFNLIQIGSDKLSLYMTETTFYNCSTADGAIFLSRCHFSTFTHICATLCTSLSNSIILYYDGIQDDFIIFNYNTIFNCNRASTSESRLISVQNSDQYFKNINITNCISSGIQIQAPQCFKFQMNYLNNCTLGFIRFSNLKYEVAIDMLNILANEYFNEIISFYSDYICNITFSNSVFLSRYYNTLILYEFDRYKFYFIDCISANFDDLFEMEGVVNVDFNSNDIIQYGYYTNDYCKVNDEDLKTLNNLTIISSLYDEMCNPSKFSDIGLFYTTLNYLSITNAFTNSNFFSQSSFFDDSFFFTKTFAFSNSEFFSNSDIFTNSALFEYSYSSSFDFTNSFEFSISNIFKDMISNSPAQTPTQSKYGQKVSNIMTYSQSYTLIKSVSFSYSLVLSNSYTISFNENIGQYSIFLTQTNVFQNIPYIIQFLSPTFIQIIISYEVPTPKKKLTSEQLIGIVCGSVAAFFGILGIFIMVKNKNHYASSDFTDHESEEMMSQNACMTVEQRVDFNLQGIANNNEIDSWL